MPVIALLTDFGTADHYVGTMKGVILGVCPEATLVDLTHEIPPQDVRAAAWQLAASARYFPAGTIFVAVVDPGVGSGRRALAAEAGAYRFLAPDNGLLDPVLRDMPPTHVVAVSNPRYALPSVSRTFEGRDRFAPAAGWLARGTPLHELGDVVASWLPLAPWPRQRGEGMVTGVVASVDRFGNLVSNLTRDDLAHAAGGGAVAIAIGDRRVDRLVETFADGAADEVCALFGSSGHLEVFVRNGSAAAVLSARAGAEISVRSVC